jgi:hypothetical protein
VVFAAALNIGGNLGALVRLERYRADRSSQSQCHSEERSDEAIQVRFVRAQLDGDCRVAARLAITNERSQPSSAQSNGHPHWDVRCPRYCGGPALLASGRERLPFRLRGGDQSVYCRTGLHGGPDGGREDVPASRAV